MKQRVLAFIVALVAGAAMAADVKVTGAAQPVTVDQLAGTETLVTVVLKDSGAKDPNLKIVEVTGNTITVATPKNDLIPYLADTIEEIQVQDGKIEGSRFKPDEVQILRAEQQRVVDRAFSRAREIFGETAEEQDLKIDASVLLALNRDTEASNYLKQLAESNDLTTQLSASLSLYLVGDTVSETLVRQGLESGNRNARALAASLTGLSNFSSLKPLLLPMFNDRAVELSAPAARALARLGDHECIPRLVSMMEELNEEKGKAAVFALAKIGGEEVLNLMKSKLQQADGKVRFRVVSVLYRMGDPLGLEEVKKIFKDYPTIAPEASLVLAKNGDWEATQFLRARLTRREDASDANLVFRAENAAALLAGGDPSAMSVFQELLRTDNVKAKTRVFELFSELGATRLIPILQPSIENVDKSISLDACEAAVAIAVPQFRGRLLEVRVEQ